MHSLRSRVIYYVKYCISSTEHSAHAALYHPNGLQTKNRGPPRLLPTAPRSSLSASLSALAITPADPHPSTPRRFRPRHFPTAATPSILIGPCNLPHMPEPHMRVPCKRGALRESSQPKTHDRKTLGPDALARGATPHALAGVASASRRRACFDVHFDAACGAYRQRGCLDGSDAHGNLHHFVNVVANRGGRHLRR